MKPAIWRILWPCLALLVATAAPGKAAATPAVAWIVTKTADTNDGLCDADCSLREAITAANETAAAGTITFALPPISTITLAGSQLPVVSGTLTIDGSTAVSLTVNAAKQSRILEIAGGSAVTLTHLTLAEGNLFDFDACPTDCGGAILNHSGTLHMDHVTVRDSRAYAGGGLYTLGTVTIMNSSFLLNDGHYGSAIYQDGTAVILFTTFENNGFGAGGAILNDESDTMRVEGSRFIRNTSDIGAGAITNRGGQVTIKQSTFNANHSLQQPGAISSAGTLLLENSTLFGNGSFFAVGGVGVTAGTARLNHVTMSENYGSITGSLYNTGNGLELINSILAGDGPQCFNGGTLDINLNNLIEDGSCNPTYQGDPLLGPLQDNGGPTLTHALLPGSPAIDAAGSAACLPTDQRGIVRPYGPGCDIGAFEYMQPTGVMLSRLQGNTPQIWQAAGFVSLLLLAIWLCYRRLDVLSES